MKRLLFNSEVRLRLGLDYWPDLSWLTLITRMQVLSIKKRVLLKYAELTMLALNANLFVCGCHSGIQAHSAQKRNVVLYQQPVTNPSKTQRTIFCFS